MHEFLLFGQVPAFNHRHLLQQLAGVTRMQPQPITEVHIVYKARPPTNVVNTNPTGGSQDIVPPEVQKTKALLASTLFYIQLIGEQATVITARQRLQLDGSVEGATRDVVMQNGDQSNATKDSLYRWRLEFRDIPDPGKQPVSIRLMSRTPIEEGDPFQFLSDFGFEFVSRYAVAGHKFYDQDTTLFLHRVLQLPQIAAEKLALDLSASFKTESLEPLDSSESYMLQASMEVADGNNPELKERATRQLLAVKETLKQSILLAPGDRLALDTRVPVASRRG